MSFKDTGAVVKSVRLFGRSGVRLFSNWPGVRGWERTENHPAGHRWPVLVLLLLTASCLLPNRVLAEEIIFLQDGRTIQAEKTEIIGDRIRIEKPAETIELPRSAVLSIHPVSPPTAPPSVPPPAEAYRDLTQQMGDKVRRENQERPGAARVR
jgi:hypothetical protein